MKFKKKPIVIEAIKFTGLSSINRMTNAWQKPFLEVADFDALDEKDNFFIETLEGTMTVVNGDYIIKGIKGEFYPCKPDIFEATYEKVEDQP